MLRGCFKISSVKSVSAVPSSSFTRRNVRGSSRSATTSSCASWKPNAKVGSASSKGLQSGLAHAEEKLAQLDAQISRQQESLDLGIPTFREIVARITAVAAPPEPS